MWDDLDEAEEEGWDGEEDEDLAVLRDRFKHLQSLIPADKSRSTKTKSSRSSASRLNVVQGYTTLIFDTNVLLNSLSLFSQLVDSGRWTLVVPLPVLTELDGLAKEPPPLGIEAIKAISYLESNVRSKSMTLRIQTTKGSYLSDLRLRTETSAGTGSDDRKTMDERILDIAKWQLDNFVDRSLMLGGPGPGAGAVAGTGEKAASKAVLVTFDRNLRLRARGMGVETVDEREMAGIFGK
jgi:predicted ribonuclease YlaK